MDKDEKVYCDICGKRFGRHDGCADDMPDSCDSCWVLMHKDDEQEVRDGRC
jgi:hypothetical protein